MSRRNDSLISELLGVVLGSPECTLSGWVGIARAANLDVKDEAARLVLARPGVTSVSVFNLGEALEKVNIVTNASLASGYAYGRINTLIGLNVLASADPKLRIETVKKLSQLLTPKGVAYFTRTTYADPRTRKSRVQYFTDAEFKKELDGFFMGAIAVSSSNPRYPIMRVGGLPPL